MIKTNIRTLIITGIGMALSMSGLTSCNDDLEVRGGLNEAGRESITLHFVLPEEEHVVTRSNDTPDERKINNLTLLLCSSAGGDDYQVSKILTLTDREIESVQAGFDSESRTYTYQMAIDPNEEVNMVQLFAVANTETASGNLLSGISKGTKYSEFKWKLNSSYLDENNGFMMSGLMIPDDETNTSFTMQMVRSAAKMTLQDKSGNDKFELLEVSIYNTAADCYLMAGVRKYFTDTNRETRWYGNTIDNASQTITGVTTNPVVATPGTVNNALRYDCYVNPTKTHEELKVYTYVMMKARYFGTECYYAVPLYKKGENGEADGYYDIEPNHWYDMTVTKVAKEGDKDPETAILNHNNNQIWVDIHDHAPEVLSMVSDGIHELGVSRQVELIDDDNNGTFTGIFTVKCFAADTDIFDENTEIEFEIEGDWIQLNETPISKIMPSATTNAKDKDNPGYQLKYQVSYDATQALFTEATGVITVKWKGLKREVTVHYNPGLRIAAVSEVVLTITNTDNNTQNKIYQYWTFINGLGESTADHNDESVNGPEDYGKIPVLYGIKPDEISGSRNRMNGFHFPMPYGENSLNGQWEYEYSINFKKLEDELSKEGNTVTITKVEWEIEGDSFITENVECSSTGTSSVNLKWNEYTKEGKTAYTYADGLITFKISFIGREEAMEIPLALFHTGFFHYDGNSNYCPEGDKGYYYYEVVPMGNGYWLDRNVGAKSNRSYIDTEDETSIVGSNKSAGRYYSIAEPMVFGQNVEDYEKERKFDMGMCPPGYRIPNQTEWDNVRLTNNYTTQPAVTSNGVSYMSTYYITGNSKIGNVYFPKARFCNSQNIYLTETKYTAEVGYPNAGDAGAGYYWTTTLAPAMEKEYTMNWLRAFYMNGASSTYSNASITDHRMPVRCIDANTVTTVKDYYVSFNAHDVTHVLLFDKASQTPLYTFPGKALGTAFSAGQWQYFYCTITEPLEDVLMLFTKVDSDGKVTVYTRDGIGFAKNNDYKTEYLTAAKAWTIQNGKYYDFCDVAFERNGTNIFNEEPDDCEVTTGGGSSTGGSSEKVENAFNAGDEVIFLWPKTIRGVDYPRVFAWTSEGTKNWFGTDNGWNGLPNQGEENGMYKYHSTITSDINGVRAISARVCKDAGDWNGIGFEIRYDEGGKYYYISHGTSSTSGGSIKFEQKDDHTVWTIQLYDYDGIEGGGGGQGPSGPDSPELKDGDFEWKGSTYVNWAQTDVGLTTERYDWSKVKPGSTLYVYYEAGSQPQIYIRCKNKDGDGDVIPGIASRYSIWETLPLPIKVTLTQEAINMIRDNGGLIFRGGNYTLTEVDLQLAK